MDEVANIQNLFNWHPCYRPQGTENIWMTYFKCIFKINNLLLIFNFQDDLTNRYYNITQNTQNTLWPTNMAVLDYDPYTHLHCHIHSHLITDHTHFGSPFTHYNSTRNTSHWCKVMSSVFLHDIPKQISYASILLFWCLSLFCYMVSGFLDLV